MSDLIVVDRVVQSFRTGFWLKPATILNDISFTVPEGSIFGLLGPNGAGKTTLIHILTGIRNPESGRVMVKGKSAFDHETKKILGYLPERPYFYEHLTGAGFLHFAAELLGLTRDAAKTQIDGLLREVGLEQAADRELRFYSKGMLQRIGFAQAMMGDPKLLILDEPMSGLDPVGRREMRDLITKAHSQGKTILLSSHILSDIEAICSDAVILKKGVVVAAGKVDELARFDAPTLAFEIIVQGLALPKFAQEVMAAPSSKNSGNIKVIFANLAETQAAIRVLVEQGYSIISVNPKSSGLEKWFEREEVLS